ncbi:MAG TPA: glutathione peroxidase [Stellaceae bacterium]|nr:glutathione peroxidase [Stellaceae bacterium]
MAEAGAFDFDFASIEGKPLPLACFRGKPLLVVNTASFCGFTPQYAGLEALYERYRERGLTVLAVPSNDFGEQEPGSSEEIASFCSTRYRVQFPLTEKVHVVGSAAHPFYRWIESELGEGGTPRWNFHKYLIAPDGSLAGAWPSSVEPLAPEIVAEIEHLL